ncbi:hypothetical protein CBFG_03340 [Clostridiales bacterium 1_7_47FAA]|nr:hypothetical protein CBFG_03340 [Clostridiales bacterium 1_7_47FAA]
MEVGGGLFSFVIGEHEGFQQAGEPYERSPLLKGRYGGWNPVAGLDGADCDCCMSG